MASALEKEAYGRLSKEEKVSDEAQNHEYVPPMDDIPDPDAGLSEEERAAHVGLLSRLLRFG